jgi:cysteinyl-tRNA synthetase
MQIELYNTLSRRPEPFQPQDPKRVTMYVCGPTVYNYVHIGNARPPVVFGVLADLLRRRYDSVVYARNITDVDDKINAAASSWAYRSRPSPTSTPRPMPRTWRAWAAPCRT